jgi:hypothetical protein
MMPKGERLKERSLVLGTRHGRKLKKYSQGFNDNFTFFFLLSRRGLIDFCGERIVVERSTDPTMTAKHCFRLFEDGFYGKTKVIECYHPNVMKHVMMGKKGWGLWSNELSMGIASGDFTKREILGEFESRSISIPECFMTEFENRIIKHVMVIVDRMRSP